MSEPFPVGDQLLRLSASVGVALSPAHSDEAEDLLICADAALYHAKADGRGRYRLFTPDLREAAQRERICRDGTPQRRRAGRVRTALPTAGATVDGALLGARRSADPLATSRPRADRAGRLPDDAGDGAARSGVGDWVLRTACAQAEVWRRNGVPDFGSV